MFPTVYYQGGTLVLNDVGASQRPAPPFQWIKEHWRCEGYHYPALYDWFRQTNIRDTVPRWQHLDLDMHDQRQPHDYQDEALVAWAEADHRGSIVLPTGSGKTFVAIRAIQHVNRSAVVDAPTIDLLHQWYARLANAFQTVVGVYYG
ncbi:MAG: DEAD/DEAH box helicase family protein, partial [Anaerolineae bacterium]|nr:DEAD/DEAH box helicase family protein [Anaerolineae bacterium]